tara:strand:+ start:3845 stop:4540 length:696 start_codon:yes stop_codon:yes gene_type:complete
LKKVAVIPARGGSTRLKDKNIHPLGDKPLIRWMTEAVVESESFDSIIISTDSDQIFDAVSDLPVERHERPEAHATTKATVLDAMIQLMKTCPKELMGGDDIFSYFLPTCPFVSKDDIKKGIKKLSGKNIDSVISMTELQDTLQLACQMSGDKVLPVLDNLECGLTNSKFIKKYYKPSGAFYMSKWDHLIENRNFFKGNVKGVLIPKERSIDINDKYDILFAESILRGDTTT